MCQPLQKTSPEEGMSMFLRQLEDVLFIWLTNQDLPARATVTGRVATSHLIRVRELEFPAVACPADEGLARLVGQELQEELPQLDWATACRTEGRYLEINLIYTLLDGTIELFYAHIDQADIIDPCKGK